jgi:pimeloyl-ACP methyl ester carboxylesterase
VTTYQADAADTQYVDGPSARFGYRRFGPQGGTPLVLLHRLRGTLDWWDPHFLDLLAAGHDVIAVDNVGTGHTSGEPRDTVAAFAEGIIEFLDALGLTTVDLLGWSLGGYVAQDIVARRPELVRSLIVAGSGPGGLVPGMPAPRDEVLRIAAKADADEDDLLYLFYPETEEGRAAGRRHLANVSTRLATGEPNVTQEAAMGQIAAIAAYSSVPFDQVTARLRSITQPVLIANGIEDIMIPAIASYTALGHLRDAKLVLYSGSGHGFLFQHTRDFATEVTTFLNY